MRPSPLLLLLLGTASLGGMIVGGLLIAWGLLLYGEAAVVATGGATLGVAGAALFLTGRAAVRQNA